MMILDAPVSQNLISIGQTANDLISGGQTAHGRVSIGQNVNIAWAKQGNNIFFQLSG